MVTFVNVTSGTLLKAEYEHDLHSNSADSPNTVLSSYHICENYKSLSQGLSEKRFYIKTFILNTFTQIKYANYLYVGL